MFISLMEWLLIIFAINCMESTCLNQDGGQWFVIRQSYLLTDCVKLWGLLTLKGN